MDGEALIVPPQDRAEKEAAAVTKAVLRAADRLGIRNAALSRVIGVSEPTLSRMRSGERLINRNQKEFELGVLFVRMYRSLDAIIGGDDTVSQQWLRNKNEALNSVPVEMIESVQGLTDVIRYLDARRAVI